MRTKEHDPLSRKRTKGVQNHSSGALDHGAKRRRIPRDMLGPKERNRGKMPNSKKKKLTRKGSEAAKKRCPGGSGGGSKHKGCRPQQPKPAYVLAKPIVPPELRRDERTKHEGRGRTGDVDPFLDKRRCLEKEGKEACVVAPENLSS